MEIKRRTRARNNMSITPLVDVVFLLLLFFALTLHFSPEEAISVELPMKKSAVLRRWPLQEKNGE